MINWKVRFKNPLFIASLVMSVLLPILSYMGLEVTDITSWTTLGNILIEAIKNPYVLVVVACSVYNASIDFTTEGVSDSQTILEDKTSDELLAEIEELKAKLEDK